MYRMLRDLRTRGYRVTAVIAADGGSLAKDLARAGIPYHVLDLEFFDRRVRGAGERLFSLVRLFRRLKPDVVQYHLFSSMILGRLAAWLADVPARFSMIPGPYHLESPVLRQIDIGTAWLDSSIIAACQFTRALYTDGGVPPDRLTTIFYGQDHQPYDPARVDRLRVRRELGVPVDRPVVGDVAYFYPRLPDSPFTPPHLVGRSVKGHDVLLRAVPKVLESVPDALFVLVGEGWGSEGRAYELELKNLARELGVERSVLFTGKRSDIPETLAMFDVSVQCSLSENLGGAIESQFMGVPLVVTRVGGLVDAVEDGVTGVVVAPDDPDDLARGLVRLLTDKPMAARVGEAGRRFALGHFTMDHTADALDALYRSTLASVEQSSLGARRGYRLSRLPWRAASLATWGYNTLVAPVKRATRPGRSEAVRRNARIPVSGTIIQMAGAIDNADWFVHICRSLRQRGHPTAAIIGWPEGPLATQLTASGIPYGMMALSVAPEGGRFRLPLYLVRFPIAVLRLARQFRRERISIVHTHIFHSILVGRLAAWLARVPCRVSMVPGPLHLEAPLTRLADRLTAWMDHRVVAGSQATASLYRDLGMTEPRLECIPYGGDPVRFDPAVTDGARIRREFGISTTDRVIGLVAHFYPPRHDWRTPPALRGRGLKGHEDFLDAAAILRKSFPDSRFLIVGDGLRAAGERYREALMERSARSGLEGSVMFTGRRDDVPDLLAAMDVAVQCSLSENYGGTIEALLLERPVVATRVGGMPETVRDGETGLLVPPGDPAALADAIGRLLIDPECARAMGRAGRALMLDRYTLDQMVMRISRMYDEVLGGRTEAAPVVSARESS